jgi:hypothetical protein
MIFGSETRKKIEREYQSTRPIPTEIKLVYHLNLNNTSIKHVHVTPVLKPEWRPAIFARNKIVSSLDVIT